MAQTSYVDDESNFPNKKIAFIINTLKPAIITIATTALALLPSDIVVDNEDKCRSTETKRQYRAYERAFKKWKLITPVSSEGRSAKSVELIAKVYFTIIGYEANYEILSAFILNEYNKIRQTNEFIEK
jgi:hypothetical protein